MCAQERKTEIGMTIAILVLALTTLAGVEAVAQDDVEVNFKARAISRINIERAASDILDIRVERWSTDAERDALVKILEIRRQPRPRHGPGRSERDRICQVRSQRRQRAGKRPPQSRPCATPTRSMRDDTKEVILITNVYIGFGSNAQGADGAKLAEYPLSFVLLKFHKDENGAWQKGVGRLFVGAKVRYDHVGNKFTIDEFPNDPVYLKDVTIK